MEDRIIIELPTDEEGYIEYDCPFCHRKFRLDKNLYNNDEIAKLYCPYCGLNDYPNNFMPKEIVDFISESAYSEIENQIDALFKGMEMKSKSINIKYNEGKKTTPKKVYLKKAMIGSFRCSNCNTNVKTDDSDSMKHYCPICGELL